MIILGGSGEGEMAVSAGGLKMGGLSSCKSGGSGDGGMTVSVGQTGVTVEGSVVGVKLYDGISVIISGGMGDGGAVNEGRMTISVRMSVGGSG